VGAISQQQAGGRASCLFAAAARRFWLELARRQHAVSRLAVARRSQHAAAPEAALAAAAEAEQPALAPAAAAAQLAESGRAGPVGVLAGRRQP